MTGPIGAAVRAVLRTLDAGRVARHGGRLAVDAAVVGVGLAGLSGIAWAGLMHQARTASALIESAARAAGAANGTLPDGAAFAWQAVPPNGDGLYLPDGTGPLDVATAAAAGPVGEAAFGTVAEAVAGPTGEAAGGPTGEAAGGPTGEAAGGPTGVGGGGSTNRPTTPANAPAPARAITLAVLGDSTAVGYGCATADEVPAVVLARGAAAALGRPVRVVSHGAVGTGAADLSRQVHAALPERPDVAVIVVGSNDVRDRIPPRRSARQLGEAVAALRAQQVPVVVGTCPDLGVITPIPQPLRRVVGLWSRTLAALQGHEVAAAGGVPVPIARIVSPDFYGRPDLFYADGFHPSGPGYAKAVAALLPEVVTALRQPSAYQLRAR